MDPNATLKMIDDAINAGTNGDEVDDWCCILASWLAMGGFEPAWDRYPMGTSYYRSRVAMAAR
jgi:hypothetical protein